MKQWAISEIPQPPSIFLARLDESLKHSLTSLTMEQNRSSQFDNLIANEICKICDADRYYLLVPYPGLAIGYLIIRKQGSMINRNVVGDRDTLLW